MNLANIQDLRDAEVTKEPFPHFVLSNFVDPAVMDQVLADYPKITKGGSFPKSSVTGGPAYEELCAVLQGPEVRQAFADKFGIDLTNRPTTLTVRGWCRLKDGKIHTDSKTKLITVLLYLNEPWESTGGRLRLLRSGESLDSAFDEVSPQFGTLLAFRNDPNAWHGHGPYEGVRRALQLNYVVDEAAVRRSERRHGLSAMVKRLNPFSKVA